MATSSALVTARALILLQLLSRLLTFGLNQALVRLAPPEVFGTAAIQFDLISSTILFLSREGIRNALLRSNKAVVSSGQTSIHKGPSEQDNGQAAGEGAVTAHQQAALATVPLWAGILVSAGTLAIYVSRLPSSTASQPDFYPSLTLYVAAALLELAIEPHYLAALKASPPQIRVRVQAEGGMAIARAVVTVVCVLLFLRADETGRGRPLLAFAVGQLAGAVWLAGRYIWTFGLGGLIYVPRHHSSSRFDPSTMSLAIANTRQSFIKHLLTESDRIAVGVICPLEDQGGYAVAMNYGSLVARIIFQPIEETLLLHFSAPATSALSTLTTLSVATRLSAHLLLLLPAFLPPLLPAILPILLPRRYQSTSAPSVLQAYLSLYIPLLSLNGILEAYHTATASPADMRRQIGWMLGSSLSFAGFLYLQAQDSFRGLVDQQEISLIYASSLAMAIRITYAYTHARRRALKTTGAESIMRLSTLRPAWSVIIVATASGAALRSGAAASITRRSREGRVDVHDVAALLGLGVGMGLLTLSVIAAAEGKELIRALGGKGKAE